MPTTSELMDRILRDTKRDPGLQANNSDKQIADGLDGGRMMNNAIGKAIDKLGVNDDGMITADDIKKISDHIRKKPALYGEFVIGHGDDAGERETGFHLVQGNDGSLKFQGRDFIDTVADAIYHVGFRYADGRLQNEDGNANERIEDVAGWLNYYLNGENRVYGSSAGETLHSGEYSAKLADAADEIFMAGGGNDKIWADAGDDTIYAGRGNDQMGGGEGNDLIKMGRGNDRASGQDGRDKIYGDDGDDVMSGDNGADRLYGGEGNDKLYAGNGNDKLKGGRGADDMVGGFGDDHLIGDRGKDALHGSEGRDKLYGKSGTDRLFGGDDKDLIYAGSGDDEMHGGDGADKMFGGSGKNKLFGGDGKDKMKGGGGADEMRGADGHDLMYGGKGNDDVQGGAGDDIMYGGRGNDFMACSGGRDVFVGGRGADIMQAFEDQQEKDVFVFNVGDTGVAKSERDLIKGFGVGVDKIDLTDYDLRWVSEADFTGKGKGEASYLGKLILIDEDGDGQIDGLIQVENSGELTKGDFIL